MTCHSCRTECCKFGKRQNRQRYQCTQCRKVFTDARDNTLDGKYLPVEKAETVLRMILEGNSVSSVERITEVHKANILKLLVLVGEKCERIMADKIRNIQVRDVRRTKSGALSARKRSACAPTMTDGNRFSLDRHQDQPTFIRLPRAWNAPRRIV